MILPATLELLAHAGSRETLASFLESASLATVDKDGEIIPAEGVQLHPFRVDEELVVERLEGEETVRVTGFHANLRFYGPLADTLSGGGLSKIATIMGQRIRGSLSAVARTGYIPSGYRTASGVTIYMSEAVTRRRNEWA